MAAVTAPDPPESPFESDYVPSISRQSTIDPPDTPHDEDEDATMSICSHAPHIDHSEPERAPHRQSWLAPRQRQRGLEPVEYIIQEEPPSVSPTWRSNDSKGSLNNNNKGSLDKSMTSVISKSAGAMVLYDHPEPGSPVQAPMSPVKSVESPMPTRDEDEEDEDGLLMPMVPFDPAMTMATTITTRMESDEFDTDSPGRDGVGDQQLALVPVKSDRDTKKTNNHHGQQLVVAKNPTEATANNVLALTKPQDLRRGFNHCFVNVPTKERLSVLFATLRRSATRKVVVICSSWESSRFHAVLFRQLEMLHVYELHERMDDDGIMGSSSGGANHLTSGRPEGGRDVARAYDEFLYTYPGILFASDVAMNEFDIPPNVDYVIQYEPPANPADYVFRMSNARIYETSCHVALLFLNPSELEFLGLFDEECDIENKELEARKVSAFQGQAEKLVGKHRDVNDFAWRAFRAYMMAYEAHPDSKIYDKSKMDEDDVRKSFGKPHIPEYSSKYFAYSSKKEGAAAAVAEKKKTKEDAAATDNTEKRSEDNKDQEKEHQRFCEKKPKTWKNEKTWRKSAVPWTTRESKSWRHTHSQKGLGASVNNINNNKTE